MEVGVLPLGGGGAKDRAEPFIHPDALGVEKHEGSRFTELTEAGTLSTTRVLRWNGRKAWESPIAKLPRGRNRPDVYCPFCGRKGGYAHTDRRLYFRHGDGEQECVPEYLESIRHRRAKAALEAHLKRLREAGQPLRWWSDCMRCDKRQIRELLPGDGGWTSEAQEVRYSVGLGERYVVFDVAALVDKDVQVGLEVRASHAVEGEKLEFLSDAGMPMLEFDVRQLINDAGVELLQKHEPLPVPIVWRVPGIECPHECKACLERQKSEDAPGLDDVDMLRRIAQGIRAHGARTHGTCARCKSWHHVPLIEPGAKVEKLYDEPLCAGFSLADGTALELQLGVEDHHPATEGIPRARLVSKTLLDLYRSVPDGSLRGARPHVPRKTLGGWTDSLGPSVCRGCRRASQSAQEVDQVWALVRSQKPELMPGLRSALGEGLGVGAASFVGLEDGFAADLDRRPEDFAWRPGLEQLAWQGFAGRVSGVQLLEKLLGVKLSKTWETLEDLLPKPHQLLWDAFMERESVPRETLVVADRVLAALSLAEDAYDIRGRTWVLETLSHESEWGHTAWPKGADALRKKVYARIKAAHNEGKVEHLDTQRWVRRAIAMRDIVSVEGELEVRLAHRDTWAEADALASGLWMGRRQHPFDGEVYSDLELTQEQQQAVALALDSHLSIITGGAGTGKTTVVRAVLQSLPGEKFVASAPTGKAADRLRQSLDGVEGGGLAFTVAKLIANPQLLVGAATLVVDEAGFLDLQSACKLFGAVCRLGTAGPSRVILVGDPHQLASVGPGAVLRDALQVRDGRRRALPVAMLTTGHRSQGNIEAFAQGLLRGEAELGLVEHIEVPEERIADEVFMLVERLGRRRDVQVIAPTRKLVATLNKGMQGRWNPRGEPYWRTGLHRGDRVICTRNRYQEPTILNGEVGLFDFDVNTREEGFSVTVNGDVREGFEAADQALFDLAYAVTIHKSQGSEWDTVVVALPGTKFVDRKMLYTAATRAKQHLIFVGPRTAIDAAARREKHRTTLLQCLLERRVRAERQSAAK